MEGISSKLKLVFVTRKVDRGDALTGFIFTWLAKLSGLVEKVDVICLEKGDDSGLPQNVSVFSMGKEKGKSRFRELLNYLRLLFKLVPKSNGIFIHMHPVYAIVAWFPAKLFGKKLILWYTHKTVDLKLRMAHFLVDEVLTASPESFRLPSKKVKVVGHGIDLEKFTPSSVILRAKPEGSTREILHSTQNDRIYKFRVVSIGRISPVKDYETLLKALKILKDQEVKDIEVQIYGSVGLPAHQRYLDALVTFVHNTDLESFVKFQGELNYDYVDEVYQEANLFVNLSQTGSIDKSVLEAAACGVPVLTSNEAFCGPLRQISNFLIFERNNPQDLAEKILHIRNLPTREKDELGKELRAWVEKEHNLETLKKRIVSEFQ